MSGAPYSHRQGAQDHLLREVAHVEPRAHDDVRLAKRIGIAISVRIEALVDVDVNAELRTVETDVAFSGCLRVHRSRDLEPAVRRTQGQPYDPGPLEDDPLETLDRDLVLDLYDVPAAGEKPGDVDRVPSNQTRPF